MADTRKSDGTESGKKAVYTGKSDGTESGKKMADTRKSDGTESGKKMADTRKSDGTESGKKTAYTGKSDGTKSGKKAFDTVIIAYIVEGRRVGGPRSRSGSRRTSASSTGSGYKQVPTDEQVLLPDTKKPESVQNFIY
uniref:Triple QxxK/R motif-containing protein n=1 Tax=Macrostomum lignano TaxID=282301 RepID=A0A1I8G4V5_9PLAT